MKIPTLPFTVTDWSQMPTTALRWLVVVVVSYAGGTLLLSATRRMPVGPPDLVEAANRG